ncbi:tRNA1(Val) (adenine(37)-N6)-methyltransferase [Caloranaerobacter azorensis]|uniref:tRNA1(Val) (Adenine(37)-N6)-methyltransferase n=1 Tax=Caloranaerobacter azorensis TaxID=116090 RepID=A0A6P1YG99_9FIRM|nr:tRNA1(Val) (adenine(37)-N6)-methyltransferase [Caloranaerobacter azorensis]QIB27793.1 tRNA1(Val) (adenine(37)-N6)-methyltransferase [Caloranaerobacter azorensis]
MRKVTLKENERIDDLQCKGLKIIQNTKGFCFGMDAVLLANFCDIKDNSEIVDLGTGTGIIPLLLWAKNKVKKIYGVEIQKDVAQMAKRSVFMNELEDFIEILNIDLKEAPDILGINKYDVVTSNPPYMVSGSGAINPEDKKAISRHEIMCTLEDVIRVASRLLRHNGRFFLVHRPHRIVDVLCLLRKYKLEPKSLRFVHPRVGEKPNLILIKSIKASKPELKFLKPLYVYNEDGSYTDEIYEIYGMERKKDVK